MQRLSNGFPFSRGWAAAIACGLLLAGASVVMGDDHAEARFRGAGEADPIRIANVTCKPAGIKGAGAVTFDLAWNHSWRAAWEVGEEQHGGKGTLKLENWDGAWVFVKFHKPGADGWSHATLSTNKADHAAPVGAALDVGLSNDGKRGVGVFVFRSAPGHGPIDWKGVTLRWLHCADGVENIDKVTVRADRVPSGRRDRDGAPKAGIKGAPVPGGDAFDKMFEEADAAVDTAREADAVEIRVFAVPMVYVPEGAFWLGDGSTNRNAAQFSAGDTTDPLRIESERDTTLGGTGRTNLGNRDSTGMFRRGDDFNSGFTRRLPARLPKGYAAFYCMKRAITRGAYTAFFTTLSAGQKSRLNPGGGIGPDPHAACSKAGWSGSVAYAAWAGLRPMTELEYEKACRGPLRPVPDEYAWGTNKAPGEDATADGARVVARASFWGILDLGGPLREYAVVVGNDAGRLFAGTHGDGNPASPLGQRLGDGSFGTFGDRSVAQPPGWYFHETGFGFGIRGPSTSSRTTANTYQLMAVSRGNQVSDVSFHCVRTAGPPAAPLGPLSHEEIVLKDHPPQSLFNEKLRIENVAVVPRDAKAATVRFDIAWDESWRNATNYDAAWVFFKVRPEGARNWQHARLAADRVLNPTGYGQEKGGTPLEFIVPDGDDGFTGLFVQRASAGAGPVTARGVTALLRLGTTQRQADGIADIGKAQIRAFGIEMVYVPEGPFYLGSGGTELNRFYAYTDGSQNTLPYRVADAGAIPTGPQENRLWATGVEPDGTDAGEIPVSFPNGYAASYCMKYSVKQGQFAGFLGMQPEIQSIHHDYRGGDWPVLRRSSYEGTSLSWWHGAAFGAWAGLRPMTELEYEKACRGPREPVPNEVGPGYWGIRNLNAGGMIERTVSAGHPAGRRFKGTHGDGTPALPEDWPQREGVGVMRRGGSLGITCVFVGPFEIVRTSHRQPLRRDGDMTGWVRLPNDDFTGWRGVRSAPSPGGALAGGEKELPGDFKLEFDPLPDLGEADVSIFYLSGRFRNGGDKPLNVELTSPLPDACFPEGAASRAFTAPAKADALFRILIALTRQTARAVRRGQTFPVRIAAPGGDVLAETTVRLPLIDPLAVTPPVIGSLDGGEVTLHITNATDRPQALKVEMTPPPGIKVSETSRRVQLAAGAEARASFPVPGQVFVDPGFHRIPYRVAVAKGSPQSGGIVAELRVQSRWWSGRDKIQAGPKMGGGDSLPTPDSVADILKEEEKDSFPAMPPDLFEAGKRPGRWESVTHGASLWLGHLKPVPSKNTLVLAATRVTSPGDREAVIKVGRETVKDLWIDGGLLSRKNDGTLPNSGPFVGRIWFNGEVVYDSRPEARRPRKPVRIRKGVNTMLVQCHVKENSAPALGNLFVLFHDAEDGKRMDDLVFDVGER